MFDIDTINAINREEEGMTAAGAYDEAPLQALKRLVSEFHQPFSGMLETGDTEVY